MKIDFGGEDTSVVATIAPVHASWKPVVVCDDGDEITVYFGNFTHVHYGYTDVEELTDVEAQSIADDVTSELSLVFTDQLEAYKIWGYFGAGGLRTRGSQGLASRTIFGANGRLWSGESSR